MAKARWSFCRKSWLYPNGFLTQVVFSSPIWVISIYFADFNCDDRMMSSCGQHYADLSSAVTVFYRIVQQYGNELADQLLVSFI